MVKSSAQDFQTFLLRLLTDDTLTTLELWAHIRDYWSDSTTLLQEIKKEKTVHRVTCTLQRTDPTRVHLYGEHTTAELQ